MLSLPETVVFLPVPPFQAYFLLNEKEKSTEFVVLISISNILGFYSYPGKISSLI